MSDEGVYGSDKTGLVLTAVLVIFGFNLKIIQMPIRDKRIFGILTGKAVKMKNRQFSILWKSLLVSVFWKSRISTKQRLSVNANLKMKKSTREFTRPCLEVRCDCRKVSCEETIVFLFKRIYRVVRELKKKLWFYSHWRICMMKRSKCVWCRNMGLNWKLNRDKSCYVIDRNKSASICQTGHSWKTALLQNPRQIGL